jgi:uncharacterized protein DUF4019
MQRALSRAVLAIAMTVWGCQTSQQTATVPAQPSAPVPASGSSDPKVSAATQAARTWLALVDEQKYADSWGAAATVFKSAVTEATWSRAVTGVRDPLGKLVSRQLESAVFKTTLPGAPDGEYVVIRFDTTFQNKAGAIETVTPKREADGTWRVSGYFIK